MKFTNFLLLTLIAYNSAILSHELSDNAKTLQQDLQTQCKTGTSNLVTLNQRLFLLSQQYQCEQQASQEICQKLFSCRNSFNSFIEAYNNPFLLADRHNAHLKDQSLTLEQQWITTEINHEKYLQEKDALKKGMQTVVITLLADKIAACKNLSNSHHLVP